MALPYASQLKLEANKKALAARPLGQPLTPLPMQQGEREFLLNKYSAYSPELAAQKVGEITAGRSLPQETNQFTGEQQFAQPFDRNKILQDTIQAMLKAAQGAGDEDLIAKRNAIVQARFNTQRQPTPEELRVLSPSQQAGLRGLDVGGLEEQLGGVSTALAGREKKRTAQMTAAQTLFDVLMKQQEMEDKKKEGETDLLSPTEAATLGVPYGTTKKSAAEQGLTPKATLTGQDKIDLEVKLANNFEQYAKESRSAQRQIGIMETGYKEAIKAGFDGSSLNAPSQAVLVTFQKMLDPTSVVRESEYARSGQGQSLWNRIAGTYEKLAQGGAGVTQKELKTFYDVSQQLLKGYQAEQLNFAKRIQTQSKNYGLNIENILTPDVLNILGDDVEKPTGQKDDLDKALDAVGFKTEGQTSLKGAMRTDRHSNPTAFTTDIAKLAGLKEGVDYTVGDAFSGGKYKTAKLLGDPIDTTIKVIDKIGFQTAGGKPRWNYINIPQSQWKNLTYDQKKQVIGWMYQKEGGTKLQTLFA